MFCGAYGVSMDTVYNLIHIFCVPSPHTDMVDSMELERGVTTTSMASELSNLNILALLLLST